MRKSVLVYTLTRNMKRCLALLLIVACVFSNSEALRCFNCKFPEDSRCENLSGLEAEECPPLTASEKAGNVEEVCIKNVIRVNKQDHITRECAKQVEESNSCSILKDLSNHCSFCKSDLCNGTKSLLVNEWSFMMSIVVASLIHFF